MTIGKITLSVSHNISDTKFTRDRVIFNISRHDELPSGFYQGTCTLMISVTKNYQKKFRCNVISGHDIGLSDLIYIETEEQLNTKDDSLITSKIINRESFNKLARDLEEMGWVVKITADLEVYLQRNENKEPVINVSAKSSVFSRFLK